MRYTTTRNIVLTALFTALGILYPQVFHLFGIEGGGIFLPMHIPVLLCGFVCGRRYGAMCGIITPLLCSWWFIMPPIFPIAVAMAFELAAYGYAAGLTVKFLHPVFSLFAAMLAGRIVYGLAGWAFFSIAGWEFTFVSYLTASFVTSWPGIVIQIVFVPLILYTLHKAKAVYLPTFKIKNKKQQSCNAVQAKSAETES